MRLIAVLIWLTLLAPPRITLAISPSVCLSPCSIKVDVVITPNPDNRWIVVIVDGPVYHSSYLELEGEKAPKRFNLTYTNLSEGSYDVRATLYVSGAYEVTHQSVTLIVAGASGTVKKTPK